MTPGHSENFKNLPKYGHYWYMASCFPTVHAHQSFQDLLRLSDGRTTLCHTWIEEVIPDDSTYLPLSIDPTLGSSINPSWSLQELTELGTVSSSDVDIHDSADAGLVVVSPFHSPVFFPALFLLNTASGQKFASSVTRHIPGLCTTRLVPFVGSVRN